MAIATPPSPQEPAEDLGVHVPASAVHLKGMPYGLLAVALFAPFLLMPPLLILPVMLGGASSSVVFYIGMIGPGLAFNTVYRVMLRGSASFRLRDAEGASPFTRALLRARLRSFLAPTAAGHRRVWRAFYETATYDEASPIRGLPLIRIGLRTPDLTATQPDEPIDLIADPRGYGRPRPMTSRDWLVTLVPAYVTLMVVLLADLPSVPVLAAGTIVVVATFALVRWTCATGRSNLISLLPIQLWSTITTPGRVEVSSPSGSKAFDADSALLIVSRDLDWPLDQLPSRKPQDLPIHMLLVNRDGDTHRLSVRGLDNPIVADLIARWIAPRASRPLHSPASAHTASTT